MRYGSIKTRNDRRKQNDFLVRDPSKNYSRMLLNITKNSPLSTINFAVTTSISYNDSINSIEKPKVKEESKEQSKPKFQSMFGSSLRGKVDHIPKRKNRTEVRNALHLDNVSVVNPDKYPPAPVEEEIEEYVAPAEIPQETFKPEPHTVAPLSEDYAS